MTPSGDGTVENALYQRCVRGDPSAWSEFVQRYRLDVENAVRLTFHRCLRRMPQEDVENVTQEIYARLYDEGCRRLRSFQGRCPMALWLRTLAIRTTLNYVTSEKRRGRFSQNAGETWSSGAMELEHPSPSVEREELEQLGDLLDRLEPVEKTALKMFYFDGLTYRQISSLLGISVQTLGSILSRAKAKARKMRAEAGER